MKIWKKLFLSFFAPHSNAELWTVWLTLTFFTFLNIPGTPVFSHYTTARRWYAPRDMAKTNNSEI